MLLKLNLVLKYVAILSFYMLYSDVTLLPTSMVLERALLSRSSSQVQEQAREFSTESATCEKVCIAGEQALVILYGSSVGESLDSLRYKRFCEKVSTSNSCIYPQTPPPTSAAAKYHSLRVYLQILEWKGCGDINPFKWGWKESNGKFAPILTDLPPAPDDLLKMIRCNCPTDCSSMRCTCRKHHVKCSPACGNCRGSGCTNSSIPEDADLDDETGYCSD